jgi:hypothetical protein
LQVLCERPDSFELRIHPALSVHKTSLHNKGVSSCERCAG